MDALQFDAAHQLNWYRFIGRVLGKALYEGILVDVAFAGFFLAKWLGKQSYLDDLVTLDPELYKGLVYLKNVDGPIDHLALNFAITHDGELVLIVLIAPLTNHWSRIWRNTHSRLDPKWFNNSRNTREQAPVHLPCIVLPSHQTNQKAERSILRGLVRDYQSEVVEDVQSAGIKTTSWWN